MHAETYKFWKLASVRRTQVDEPDAHRLSLVDAQPDWFVLAEEDLTLRFPDSLFVSLGLRPILRIASRSRSASVPLRAVARRLPSRSGHRIGECLPRHPVSYRADLAPQSLRAPRRRRDGRILKS
jgi:hypothetical protein